MQFCKSWCYQAKSGFVFKILCKLRYNPELSVGRHPFHSICLHPFPRLLGVCFRAEILFDTDLQSLLLQKSAVSGFCFLCLYWLCFQEKTLSIYVNDLGLLWNVCNGTWVIFFGSFRYMIVTKLPDPLALCLQKSLMVLEIKCPVWKHLLFSIQSLLSKRFPPTISSCLFSDTRTLACSLYWVVSEVTYVVGNFFRYSVCSSALI